MAKLINLADLQQINFICAKVASAKVNKTKVPAFLCSLDVGPALLEVQVHLRQNCGRPTHVLSLQPLAQPKLLCSNRFLSDMSAYVFHRFGCLSALPLALPLDYLTHHEHRRLHGKPLYASSAQLTVQHTKEEVNGKTLLTVANFPRKQIGPRMSDCLITGVQVNSKDDATRKASTVMVQCSHAVQPGMLITVTGHAEQLQANARNLSWDSFTSASILVGTVIDAVGGYAVDESDCLSAHEVMIDFGESVGPRRAQAILNNTVFTSIQLLLNIQLLAVTNLASDESEAARTAVLTVGGLAVLQPAKQVANGYSLA